MPDYRKALSLGTGAEAAFLGSKEWAAKWAWEDKAFENILKQITVG
jgi:hypothetical protein